MPPTENNPAGEQADRLPEWIAERMQGKALAEADKLLDEARRLCWMAAFSGSDARDLAPRLGTPAEAVEIAVRLGSVKLMDATYAIELARHMLWGATFATYDASAFAGFVRACQQRSDDGRPAGKLN